MGVNARGLLFVFLCTLLLTYFFNVGFLFNFSLAELSDCLSSIEPVALNVGGQERDFSTRIIADHC